MVIPTITESGKQPRRKKPRFGPRFFRISRWLHVYTSTALFGLLAFFCLTGIFLNHGWYGDDDPRITVHRQPLGEELRRLLPAGEVPDTRELSQVLENRLGLGAPASIDVDVEYGEVVVNYDVPAGYTTVLFDLPAGEMEVERQHGSAVGILNDLHKGRHSGTVWSWIIDGSGVLMLIFALTGMILLFQNKRIRRPGLWAALWGLLTPVLVYLLFVPSH